VYIANGQDPEHGEGVGHLYAIDATKRGDITQTGRVWHYDKIRRSISTTAVHEGFPGHDWHYKYMTAHAADISPVRWLTPGAVEDSFSMWEDSMASEGWALYAEELMAEPSAGAPHGFYDAGEHLYELQAQLLRAVRVRVDVGLHTRRMSFDEAVDYYYCRGGE